MKVFLGMFVNAVTESEQHNVILPAIFQVAQ